MFVVDTNLLIYAANRDAPRHEACRAWLEGERRGAGAWFLTWSIVYEFLRVITHPRVLTSPWSLEQGWSFVQVLLASPGLEVLVATERHDDVLTAVLAACPHLAGNVLHDVHTATLMREHGVRRIATHDLDFHRFPFLEPFDPVA